jgi:hypothetical protein
MKRTAIQSLSDLIRSTWSETPNAKAKPCVGKFLERIRIDRRIEAKVEGNHGTYTLSIDCSRGTLRSACSCYIGADGSCHHCHALGISFLHEPATFVLVKRPKREQVRTLEDLHGYLKGVTLNALVEELQHSGITQRQLTESIGMNPRHLSAIKSAEARHHYFHELGATKLACLWVLEHIPANDPPTKKSVARTKRPPNDPRPEARESNSRPATSAVGSLPSRRRIPSSYPFHFLLTQAGPFIADECGVARPVP